ncbi:hypothetical protein I3843_11G197100 [Carya illinoinensis]|uniref:Uncharacterized protein n=1 Tax=Carya illinoinensis TaxID=32201 RepID=A0A922DSM0_CARIL|nr:hypothetical protein I3760_11G196400 [Carya illinoinensis]KAG6689954.1 hypothetical protein I3842_11G199200 [Carya illinoinensis]KAG7957874.1 hypothetical protein I3843_11G197100 [Carya illinoinensis]
MDQTGFNKRQTLTQFMSVQFLKKVTQLLLSVSVFSFFFSHSSLISFPQSFNFYFSTFPFQLFSHTIDKNSIFLLCNGLLVFLAQYSGLTRSLSGSTYNDEYSFESEGNGLQPESSISESKKTILEKEVMVEDMGTARNVALEQEREREYLIKELEKETEKSAAKEGGGGGGENGFSNSKEEVGIFVLENEEEQNETVTGLFLEEEEEEGNGMLSTEELNKKFEDFIRRMKEEIRIEA